MAAQRTWEVKGRAKVAEAFDNVWNLVNPEDSEAEEVKVYVRSRIIVWRG